MKRLFPCHVTCALWLCASGLLLTTACRDVDKPSENARQVEARCRALHDQFYANCRKDTLNAFKAVDELASMLHTIDDDLLKATVIRCIGDGAEQRNHQAEAIEWYRQALALLNGLDGREAELEHARLLMSKGLVYHKNSDLQRAFELYLDAENRLYRYKDYDQLLRLYPKIGDIYLRNQMDTVQNRLYIDKAEAILPHIKDTDQIANFYIVKANTLFHAQLADSAMVLMQRAIDLLKRVPEPDQYLLGTAYFNLAYYLRHFDRYREAEGYDRQSYEAFQQTGIRYDMSDALTRIGTDLYYQERFVEAERYLLKGLALADSIGSKGLMRNACDVLSYLAYERGRFKDAYYYLDRYVTLHLAILSEQEQATINFLHAKHEDDRKRQQILALKERNRLMWYSVGGLVLVMILALVAFLYRQRSLRNERRLAEERVAFLEREKQLVATKAIMEGETAERARLARDLHDGLGGMLSVIKLNVHQVKTSDLMVAEDTSRLENVLQLLDQSMQELRRVAHNMMPEALVKYGLKAALADFCTNIAQAHFHHFGEEKRLDPNLELAVYRTAFELVNNVLRHAEATTVNIQLVQQRDRLALTVHDDGKGFDVEKVRATSDGRGLANIANRAAACGGSMDILSVPGQGTEITVEFIIPNAI